VAGVQVLEAAVAFRALLVSMTTLPADSLMGTSWYRPKGTDTTSTSAKSATSAGVPA